jgi:NAD-dependent dihydropyrimidine dehydrogenase PreA subunit
VVADLCGLAASRDPRLKSWIDEGPLAIVACFPRAIRWLFHAAGVPLSNGRTQFYNMRTQSPEEIIRGIADLGFRIADSGHGANPQSAIRDPQSSWVPWFPVIDYDRCRNCKQCLNFCLFGVYKLSDEGRVEVRNPAGCKTNCPACARMCPQKAIIFPKYADPPINGDEVPPGTADLSREANPHSNDLYDKIRRRGPGHKRFSKQADEAASTRSCPTLESLRRELDIPQDVLTSLSPAELQRITAKSRGSAGLSPGSQTDVERKDGGHDG